MGRSRENVIVGLFCLIFLYYAAQALLIDDTFRLFFVLIPALILTLVPLLVEYKMSVVLIPGTKSLIALALLLHVAGGINRFYWLFALYYDKLAHVISAIALILVVFCFFEFLAHYGKSYSYGRAIAGAILITTIFMISWEVMEYSIDLVVQSSYNNGFADTIGDLIADVIGIGIGLLVIRHYISKIPAGKDLGWLLSRDNA